jgi:hypothetical protein
MCGVFAEFERAMIQVAGDNYPERSTTTILTG